MAVIEPLWESVDIYNSYEDYEKCLVPFNLQQRAVFSIMWLIGETFNGGLYQFYTNATGIVWEDAMNGFELIGMNDASQVIKESSIRFSPVPSFNQEEREDYLDSTDIDFEDLDDKLYALDNEINLTATVANYIAKNRSEFYFEGEVEI